MIFQIEKALIYCQNIYSYVLEEKNSEIVFILIENKNDLENQRKVSYEEKKNLQR